jgi:hypothetical protein
MRRVASLTEPFTWGNTGQSVAITEFSDCRVQRLPYACTHDAQ